MSGPPPDTLETSLELADDVAMCNNTAKGNRPAQPQALESTEIYVHSMKWEDYKNELKRLVTDELT